MYSDCEAHVNHLCNNNCITYAYCQPCMATAIGIVIVEQSERASCTVFWPSGLSECRKQTYSEK